jgi:hypothetical protein
LKRHECRVPVGKGKRSPLPERGVHAASGSELR